MKLLWMDVNEHNEQRTEIGLSISNERFLRIAIHVRTHKITFSTSRKNNSILVNMYKKTAQFNFATAIVGRKIQ